jgi:hypothetical protein
LNTGRAAFSLFALPDATTLDRSRRPTASRKRASNGVAWRARRRAAPSRRIDSISAGFAISAS